MPGKERCESGRTETIATRPLGPLSVTSHGAGGAGGPARSIRRSRFGLSALLLAPFACTPLASAGADGGAPPGNEAGPTPETDGGTVDGATKKGPLAFTPSNVDLGGIDLTKVGDFVVDAACSINTDSNLASCGDGANVLAFKIATQSDGTKVGVYVARSMTIDAGASLSVVGTLPLVFIALDTIVITGTLSASSREDVAEAGGHSEGMTGAGLGKGPGGGGTPTALTGGGGASYCGVGGAGAAESGATAPGGATYGSPALSPLVAGSAGGVQGSNGGGGAGGGAVQLVAGTSITVGASGVVQAGAGGGELGGTGGQGAAGGGSGGSILLESVAVVMAGTSPRTVAAEEAPASEAGREARTRPATRRRPQAVRHRPRAGQAAPEGASRAATDRSPPT